MSISRSKASPKKTVAASSVTKMVCCILINPREFPAFRSKTRTKFKLFESM
ncbi:hypothetical protein VARIO8X_50032 [Burkholderiales bacterium 8X]|nr:hypothetical protein VARIO8X_50032 [Burkholderiales bacterium 8X]